MTKKTIRPPSRIETGAVLEDVSRKMNLVLESVTGTKAHLERQALELRDELGRRLDILELSQRQVINDIGVLKTDVGALRTDVAVLKTDVAVLKTDVAVLKTDVAVLKTDVAVLKTDVAVLKTDVAVLTTDVRDLKAGQARLEHAQLEMSAQLSVVAIRVSRHDSAINTLRPVRGSPAGRSRTGKRSP